MTEDAKAEINLLLKEILCTPINDEKCSLFVLLNGIRYLSVDKDKEPVVETKTIFYEIKSSDNRGPNVFGSKTRIIDFARFKASEPNPSKVLQDKDTLANALGYIPKENNDEILLITWDHGSAFGIFRDNPPGSISNTMSPVDEEKDLERFTYLKIFWQKALETDKNFADSVKCQKENIISLKQGHTVYNLNVDNNLHYSFYKTAFEDRNAKKYFSVARGRNTKPFLICDPGFFTKEPALSFFESRHEAKEEILKLSRVSMQGQMPEILRNDELAGAIQRWAGDGKKIGVLLMMNCWMMNLHTMYTMKDCVKCLVAPQGDIGIPGYNIRDILRYLNDKKNISIAPQELAGVCIDTTENDYANYRLEYIFNEFNIDKEKSYFPIPFWKVFAVNLDLQQNGKNRLEYEISLFAEAIENIIKEIKDKTSPEMKYFLKYIRAICFNFINIKNEKGNEDSLMPDIVNWCYCLLNANSYFDSNSQFVMPPFIKNFIFDFINEIAQNQNNITPKLIIKATKGEKVYNTLTEKKLQPVCVTNLNPTGYSLFFPLYEFSDPKLISNIQNDKLLNNTLSNWEEFLQLAINDKIKFKS